MTATNRSKSYSARRFLRGRRKWAIVLGIPALLTIALFASAGAYEKIDDGKARMTTPGPYQPAKESLNSHPVPKWFEDAKFGIFIHWGLFSVPGYAPKGNFSEVLRTDYDRAMLVHPYAEDYWNAMKDPTTPTAGYHRKHYGDMPYRGFKEEFNEGLKQWDADAWAKIFRDAGAEYVVIVAKYHDGYSLWPTEVENTHATNWHSERDVVGELATAVRKQGMRFGIYYSGGVDWTFQRETVRTLGDYTYLDHGSDYATYADAQVRELIDRYEPDILWNDISWPTGEKRAFALFADYYNTVPDGVVNDRWQTASLWKKLMGTAPGRAAFDTTMKFIIKQRPEVLESIKPPAIPHSDFTTPEYTKYSTVQTKKWEMTRAIGNSYGYNQNETDEDYASFERTLLPDFVDAVSKNGNLLLNVGPRGEDARIPSEQLSRLTQFGNWLEANGEAVYGTHPWKRAEAVTDEGIPVRFTQRGRTVNLIILGAPSGDRLKIKDVSIAGEATLLADGSPVDLRPEGADLVLAFKTPLKGEYAPAISIASNQ